MQGVSIYFALARYNADGLLDTSFGDNGKVITDFGGGSSATVLQPDGKIVAVGFSDTGSSYYFALARYLIPSVIISDTAEAIRQKYALLQLLQQ